MQIKASLRRPRRYGDSVTAEALLNPELARTLLMKTTPAKRPPLLSERGSSKLHPQRTNAPYQHTPNSMNKGFGLPGTIAAS